MEYIDKPKKRNNSDVNSMDVNLMDVNSVSKKQKRLGCSCKKLDSKNGKCYCNSSGKSCTPDWLFPKVEFLFV